jgi:hypothetical protein
MKIETLKCPLNTKNNHRGPLISEGISGFGLHYGDEAPHSITDEQIRLFEKLAPLPKPDLSRSIVLRKRKKNWGKF